MRTKEIEKITHFYFRTNAFSRESKKAADAFPFYKSLIKELQDKSRKLYDLHVNENVKTKVSTSIKKSSKDKAIRHIMKLKRGVVLHAMESGNKSLQHACDYTYSDFSRPPEETRLLRFRQVLNAAKRMKNPMRFGISKELIPETEKLIEAYCRNSAVPAKRKKERARQAKQCRKMLGEINFILRRKMIPFIENIKDEYPLEHDILKSFLNPVKVGRPAAKRVWKRKSPVVKAVLPLEVDLISHGVQRSRQVIF